MARSFRSHLFRRTSSVIGQAEKKAVRGVQRKFQGSPTRKAKSPTSPHHRFWEQYVVVRQANQIKFGPDGTLARRSGPGLREGVLNPLSEFARAMVIRYELSRRKPANPYQQV
jgi:hypothetical protein